MFIEKSRLDHLNALFKAFGGFLWPLELNPNAQFFPFPWCLPKGLALFYGGPSDCSVPPFTYLTTTLFSDLGGSVPVSGGPS